METNNIHSFPGRAKGKKAPVVRDSVPFGKFLKAIPTAPIIDLAPNYVYPMDGNDTVGDCVVAAWDHFRQAVTGLLTGTPQNFTQEQLWAFYKTQNPSFDPNGTADTNGPGSSADCGMSVQIFLEYLQAQGYIVGFAKIDQTNESEMKAAVYLGLGIMTGVVLDQAQMEQFNQGVWDNVPGSPVDGGHCIPLLGYLGSPDQMTCISWAKAVQCTQAFILNQMDEAWFIITPAHVANPGFRDHFDIEGFATAVSEISNGAIKVPLTMNPFTEAEFMSFYTGTEYATSAQECYAAVTKALTNAGIFSPLVLVGALATIRTEVGRMYQPVEEEITMAEAIANYGSTGNDLGNVPGTQDGYTFRGRGLIQLTGRYNYTKYGAELGIDLVDNPDAALTLSTAAAILAQFFKDKAIDVQCNACAWVNVRELVNGGTDGLGTFLDIIGEFIAVMS